MAAPLVVALSRRVTIARRILGNLLLHAEERRAKRAEREACGEGPDGVPPDVLVAARRWQKAYDMVRGPAPSVQAAQNSLRAAVRHIGADVPDFLEARLARSGAFAESSPPFDVKRNDG